jgi:hypothetical protein
MGQIIWLVFNPDHPNTPIGGAFSTLGDAEAAKRDVSVILKLVVDTDQRQQSN